MLIFLGVNVLCKYDDSDGTNDSNSRMVVVVLKGGFHDSTLFLFFLKLLGIRQGGATPSFCR